ncbi:MAG: helix-turn-helix domain-containing protein [Cytophagales bacterium]|nr:helix-turn-helix domain-containing protein [Cytophagales bacterium]
MEILYSLGVSHAVFGFALLLAKKPSHISNTILGIWIFLLGIVLCGKLIPVPVVSFFRPGIFPIFICFGPFLYLYIKSLTVEKYRFSRRELIHFLPFLIIAIHRSFGDPVSFDWGGGYDFRNQEQIVNFVYYCITTISISLYTLITFKMINKHKSNLQNIYSYESSRYTLNWVRTISVMFLLIFTLSFIAGAFHSILPDISTPFRHQSFGSVFFIIMASFFGLNQPVILIQESGPKALQIVERAEEVRKYLRSGLSKEEKANIQDKILDHLEKKKSYLNPEYNINMLSEELTVSRHHVTQVINSNLNKNFYTLIKEMRVNEVVNRLHNPAFSNYTILAIAFDSGFNSKSAFNRAFKQTTGKTPSEYKSLLSAGKIRS